MLLYCKLIEYNILLWAIADELPDLRELRLDIKPSNTNSASSRDYIIRQTFESCSLSCSIYS